MTSDTHPLIVPRVKQYLTGQAGFDGKAWRAWQVTWFTRGFQTMEARLRTDSDTRTFCHGDSPTIADICLMSVVAVAKIFKIKAEDIQTIDRIVARCLEIDAFAQAEPTAQSGAPRET